MKEQRPSERSEPNGPAADDGSPSRSISQILQEIVSHVSEIIGSEIKLATTEIKQDLAKRATAATYILIAGMMLQLAGAFLLLGVVYALSTIWQAWLSALTVGAVTGIIGGILFFIGQGKMKQPMKLDVTTRTTEDNLAWIKKQVK